MGFLALFGTLLKGAGMGAANVVPGVSGGTIALITGIYPRLIEALRNASQAETIKMLFRGEWKRVWQRIDAAFLIALGVGVALSILTLARAFDFFLEHHETATMAFFFGLVLISVYHVGQSVERWNVMRIGAFVFGTAVALGLAFVAPGEANAAPWYLVLCGVAAMCSMILPGLSGSFVLILMGNYILVLRAVKEFDLGVLLPLGIGCAAGLLGFVQLIGWALKKAPDFVIALMTGFVCGSLLTIWPWKAAILEEVEVAGERRSVVTGYEWNLPAAYDSQFILAVALMIIGAVFLHVVTVRTRSLE